MPSCSPAADARAAPPDRAALLAALRRGAFGLGGPRRPRRIGAEAELIPVTADTGAPVPILDPEGGPCSLPLLRRHAAREGWREQPGAHGAPVFHPPQGGVVSYEPGGQIEYSSAPCATVGELLRALHGVVVPLRRAAAEEGVSLLAVGIDPRNAVERVPLQSHAPRYVRMAEYLARRGPAGARMMRQTASLHVSLDWEADPYPRWRLLNAAAPLLLAIFANSPEYEGRATGARSYRARVWRELDPGRTGVQGRAADPAASYLRFALGARALLNTSPGEEYPPFGDLLARGRATGSDWEAHLTTLFPEVRPRGFAEVRSLDAVDPEWYAAPLALLAGLVHCARARADAQALLGPPTPELLARAGEAGLGDPAIAARAAALFEIGLRGAAGLGDFVDGASLERAQDFFQRFTRRGLDPGSETAAIA